MKYNKKGESRIEISDILNYFKDINAYYNDSSRYDTLKRMLEDLVAEMEEDIRTGQTAGRWIEKPCADNKHCRRIECSKCGKGLIVYDSITYEKWCEGEPYCSKCGSRNWG